MPHRPGLDDSSELKNLIQAWVDGEADIASRQDLVFQAIQAELRGATDVVRLDRLRIQAQRLEELRGVTVAVVDDLTQSTHEFLTGTGFDRVYAAGAALSVPFSFTLPHRAAVDVLAQDTFDDVLVMTDHLDVASKAFVRRVGRELTGFKLTGGEPVKAQARRLASDLRTEFGTRGITAITYADGSRHGFGEYSEMLLRTKTGIAYASGTLNQGLAAGIRWYEILDGAECFAANTELAGLGGLEAVARQYVRGKRMRRVCLAGESVTVGLNHPMLTPTGFVRAGDLREGDHLLYGFDLNDPVALALLDLQDRPTTAEKIFQADSGTVTRRPATADDLHSDAVVGEAEIEVVRTDRPLLNPAGLARLLQECGYSQFVFTDGGAAPVGGQGGLGLLLVGVGPPSGGGVGGGHLVDAGGGAHLCPDLPTEFAGRPLADPRQSKGPFDLAPGVSSLVADLCHVGACHVEGRDLIDLGLIDAATIGQAGMGAVAADRVSFGLKLGGADLASWHRVSLIEEVDYTGFVYDAQSRAGLLALNGIVAGNCGLVAHHDPQLANGLIVSAEIAMAFPLSHPNAFMGGQDFLPVGPVTQIVRAGYSGPAVTIRATEDHDLTVSPEHPVFTRHGWIPASLVEPGDYVLGYSVGFESGVAGSYFDEGDVSHDGFAAAVQVGSRSLAVPSADDLHGAGRFCDPQIDVVDLDGALWDHVQAQGFQGTRHGVFHDSRLYKLLLRLGGSEDLFPGALAAKSRGVRGSDESGAPIRFEFVPAFLHGGGPGPDGESLPAERGSEGGLVDGQSLGLDDLGAGHPGEVEPVVSRELAVVDHGWRWHRVVSVVEGFYRGFVYDASTVDGAYVVNGLVVANCRRSLNPRPDVTKGDLDSGSVRSVQSPEAAADQAGFEAFLRAGGRAQDAPAVFGGRNVPRAPLTGSGALRAPLTSPAAARAREAGRAAAQTVTRAQARAEAATIAQQGRMVAARDAAKAGGFRGKVDPAVLERWKVSEEQFLNARAIVGGIKADVRAISTKEADALGAWLDDSDLASLSRPARLVRQTDVLGRTRSVRTQSGYDFLETLSDPETARVRNRMVGSDLFSPDVLAERVRVKTNLDLSDDEAMNWVVDRWLHEDALRSLASGRIPKYADINNLIPGDYANEGYDLGRLFGVDVNDAAGHVASVQAEAGQRFAAQALGVPEAGPAPWTMEFGAYLRELEQVEQILSSTQVAEGIDPGPVFAYARARIRELAPAALDPTGSLNPADLFEMIRITAQTAGLATA